MAWQAKKSGALIIEGGVSKHRVLWWSLISTIYVKNRYFISESANGN